MDFDKLSDDASVEKTAAALRARGIDTFVVGNRDEARRKVLELIPEGSEVIEGSSTTMNEIGATKEIEESGKYVAVKKKFQEISDPGKRAQARRQATSSDYGTGSVQAITEDGQMFVASATGSQIGFYSFGAMKVVLVAGTQKIVKDMPSALDRIYDYVLPLENERAKTAYNGTSSVNKILIINKDFPGRISIVLVKEKLGF